MQRPGRKRRDGDGTVTDGIAESIDRVAAERLLTDVMESTSTQVAIIDAACSVVTANAAFRDEFAGRREPSASPVDELPGFTSPQAQADLLSALRQCIEERCDILLFVHDPASLFRRWWEVSVAPLPSHPGAVLRLRDVTDLVETARRAGSVRRRDPLTGLLGPEAIDDHLANLRRQPGGQRTCVAVFQIDQADLVRTALGEQGANELLQQVLAATRLCLPPRSELGRVGEAFVAVFSSDDESDGDRIVSSLRDAVRQPVSARGRTMRVTASIGYTIGGPNDADPLARARAAFLEATAHGGNRAMRHGREPGSSAEATLRLWNELRTAIQYRQMEVWFQPIVTLATRHPVGAEALSRWHHPQLGDVSPDQFIPSAERNSEILNIGAFVHERSCQVARAMRADTTARLRDFQLSFNAAAEELAWPQFSSSLLSRVAANDARPEWLTVEVAERAVDLADSAVVHNLTTLAGAGMTLSLDGVGRSVSLLPRLIDLGVRRTKIERSLVAEMLSDGRTGRVVESLVGLAVRLGLDVVATGVETPMQSERLQQIGCRAGQGFLFSPAVPEPELSTLLRDLADS